ncbi:MAG: hypothetical protein EZS28_013868 [Streblomastix strix]|uniref:Uncharacterized protein n=1 Tax=Streblomastix strix TaxID=222440 RepID=A0A5J4W7G4_9EUKA|nr:MAG: hypothetical protein EZS28_013868 [Streblomastix strix]
MNKIDLMAGELNKLKNIDLLFRNWTLSIKNYAVTGVTANMSGYKATDDYLQRVREFFANRRFVVSAQRVEAWSFPTSATTTGIRTSQNIPLSHVVDLCPLFSKEARATTCYENPCYHNINLNLLFEATDEFVDSLTTPRNTVLGRLNPHTDLTSFMITLQCERKSNRALTFDGQDINNQNVSVELREASIFQSSTDCYYNINLMGKIPPPPILCTIHDIFWLFGHVHGCSRVFDVNNTFDEVITYIEG